MTTRYITSEDGDRTDVVLSVAEYEALMEDLQDLAVIAERKDEPKDGPEAASILDQPPEIWSCSLEEARPTARLALSDLGPERRRKWVPEDCLRTALSAPRPVATPAYSRRIEPTPPWPGAGGSAEVDHPFGYLLCAYQRPFEASQSDG